MPVSCSDVAVDMFVEASLISGVVAGFGVDANRNVLAGVMTALKFANSEPFEGFSC